MRRRAARARRGALRHPRARPVRLWRRQARPVVAALGARGRRRRDRRHLCAAPRPHSGRVLRAGDELPWARGRAVASPAGDARPGSRRPSRSPRHRPLRAGPPSRRSLLGRCPQAMRARRPRVRCPGRRRGCHQPRGSRVLPSLRLSRPRRTAPLAAPWGYRARSRLLTTAERGHADPPGRRSALLAQVCVKATSWSEAPCARPSSENLRHTRRRRCAPGLSAKLGTCARLA